MATYADAKWKIAQLAHAEMEQALIRCKKIGGDKKAQKRIFIKLLHLDSNMNGYEEMRQSFSNKVDELEEKM